jgi:cell division protein FtsB
MRLTVDEYSKHFKMSKEMINSKLRAKKLNYIIENGTTYVIVTKTSNDDEKLDEVTQAKVASTALAKPKTTVAMVLGLYQKENRQLKEKIVQLEAKIDKLIDDKEQMLRDEMNKIEHVYSAKDEQLKNILELINTQMKIGQRNTIHDVETLDKPVTERKDAPQIIELKEYLKTLELEPYQRKIIKKRFLAAYDGDVRIIKQNGGIYLDFSKYDYGDLLDY